jgi:cytoskeletal protein CcmA (bactofilin family)
MKRTFAGVDGRGKQVQRLCTFPGTSFAWLLRYVILNRDLNHLSVLIYTREVSMALWKEPAQNEQKEKPEVEQAAPTPPPVSPTPQRRESPLRERRESVFGPGVSIEGKIEGDADVRIAGKFKGEIHIKGDLNIERGAHLAAKINADTVTIAGELEGNIVATAQVRVSESGQLIGDLKATTLTVAAGSRMRGHVEFGWSESESAKVASIRAQEKAKNGAAG